MMSLHLPHLRGAKVLTRYVSLASIIALLAACAARAPQLPTPSTPTAPPAAPPAAGFPAASGKGQWVPASWSDLPGFDVDNWQGAWQAWVLSCARPLAQFAPYCAQVQALAAADVTTQRDWLQQQFTPYRVQTENGETRGLLTSYYEPIFSAQRVPGGAYQYPLHRTPAGFAARKPWFTRAQADTLPEAQAALQGREIAYLDNPVDVLVLQIQGSGQLQLQEADGSSRRVRVAFAGTNGQPYQSVARWLAQNTSLRNYTWPAIKAWASSNPSQVQAMVWSNPRVVFFKEEAVTGDNPPGPKGAQGVPLTAGRSIAVDPSSIPYGAPVWLYSTGSKPLQRLVIAQDTGSAIRGAVRADFYAGSGVEAGDFAGTLKQPLWLWVLWPKKP